MLTIEFPEGTFEVARNYNHRKDPCEGCFFKERRSCPHLCDCTDFNDELPGSYHHHGDGYAIVFKRIPEADASVTVAKKAAGTTAKTPPKCTETGAGQEK